MMQELKPIPKWILIVSGCFALLGLIVSSTLVFVPKSTLQTVDLNAKGVDFLIYMWAVRQFAVGFIFGFATFKKSRPMLVLAYTFFLVMNIGDIFVGVSQHNNSLIGGALLMSVVASSMIYFINKKSFRDV
jgi:hypothetical protein